MSSGRSCTSRRKDEWWLESRRMAEPWRSFSRVLQQAHNWLYEDERRMAKFTQYAMAATQEALEDANWHPEDPGAQEATVSSLLLACSFNLEIDVGCMPWIWNRCLRWCLLDLGNVWQASTKYSTSWDRYLTCQRVLRRCRRSSCHDYWSTWLLDIYRWSMASRWLCSFALLKWSNMRNRDRAMRCQQLARQVHIRLEMRLALLLQVTRTSWSLVGQSRAFIH